MMFPDDIAADLPAPHDDEPESLRQDIVDELADHLQCSLNRELLASSQASPGREPRDSDVVQTARLQVLGRFGNPAAIARQLWWDAMQEKIMTKHITRVLAAAGVLAVIAFVGMLLQRHSLIQQRLMSVQEELRADLAAVTAQLSAATAANEAAAATGGRPLRHLDLRLVLDKPGGQPAAGYRLATAGVSQDKELVRLVDPLTDEDGRATLSMNRIGVFYMTITTPQGESSSTLIPMGPEHPDEVELVVPSSPDMVQDVRFDIPRPETFSDVEYLFEVVLKPTVRIVGGLEWYTEELQAAALMFGGGADPSELRVLVDNEGEVIGRIAESGKHSIRNGVRLSVAIKTFPGRMLPAGDYELRRVIVLEPLDDPEPGQRDRLARPTGVEYEFAPETALRTVETLANPIEVPLPAFVWREMQPESTVGTASGETNAR